jgi:FkbM family methyltransferase
MIRIALRNFLASKALSNMDKGQLQLEIFRLAKKGVIDTEEIFYATNGILQYRDTTVSGERYLFENILPKCAHGHDIIVCDVGANVGDYAAEVLVHFPNARIVAFEPHPASFRRLADRFSPRSLQVSVHNIGLSSQDGELLLYDYENNDGSVHASLYSGVLTEQHKQARLASNRIRVTTLDHFCCESGLAKIDLLKIDTEGHELSILRGAAKLIANRVVPLIQFEFNEMNVFSRVFMKDFYELLPEFVFYRLAKDHLIALGNYDSRHEIFKFQNILAVRCDVDENGWACS